MRSIPPPLALVTGASTGIGLELAKQFAAHDFDVVMVAEEAAITDAAAHIARPGVRVEPIRLDLTRPENVETLAQRLTEIGEPTALALNAGTGTGGAFVTGTTLADQLAVVDLNVRSTVHLAKLLLPGMVERAHGRVLFTSSIAATAPGPYQAVYNASKAFVQSFAKALREELKDTGVTVTALLPGPTATHFFARAGMLDTRIATGPKDDPTTVARDGYEALMNGKRQVVAGSLINRAQTAAARLLPDSVLTAAHRLLTKPGTARG
ncbi:SDR family NAD(P)-dependent oxidoreductase [Actinokineospora iranica]|uniref:Short-chain dehydrogenase n=1 Tax=Actinokineospora iranica TaxID=1271860 RepID=A0A1G6XGG2_9PSEU|nr:SDR family NAD(P)-dependent oxidoreductase [Actinokineospora iranica]SDD76415.1 Short-chain dehydrogenase [Actinokineospora iranica]